MVILSSCVARAPSDVAVIVDYAVPNLGVVVDAEQRVIDVDPGGVLDLTGVQRGDVLVSLDGVSFQADPDAIEQLIADQFDALLRRGLLPTTYTIAKGKPLRPPTRQPVYLILPLVLERTGQRMTVEIDLLAKMHDAPARGGLPTPTPTPVLAESIEPVGALIYY